MIVSFLWPFVNLISSAIFKPSAPTHLQVLVPVVRSLELQVCRYRSTSILHWRSHAYLARSRVSFKSGPQSDLRSQCKKPVFHFPIQFTSKMHQPEKITPEDTRGPPGPSVFRAPDGAAPGQNVEPLVLPPDTNAEKFEDYVRRAADIVGRDNVTIVSDRNELSRYSYHTPSKASDVFWIMENDYFLCSAVVAPNSVPEVQALMKLANEFE